MIGYREIVNIFKQMGLTPQTTLLAHVAPHLSQQVKGGASTILGALLAVVDNAMLPAFTHSTLVIPENGPEDNALSYGSGRESNLSAEIFNLKLPADAPYQPMADTFLGYPLARRSTHPALSFIGLGLNDILESQTVADLYGSIRALLEWNGWVLLMGVDQTSNFSIHFAEYLSGRKQFTRWALTPDGIVECVNFPGCADGFNKLQYHLDEYKHETIVDGQVCQAYPLTEIIDTASRLLRKDPYSLLCSRLKCERCNAVRQSLQS